ncbi:oligosaccharide repeat unit polymerase [Alphaproteobacteria bacterium KMM 3653]|uniref:Oligosaccharide repeat unit polymerase n=1 Tax=Harenicola maris TaxID=2841044 RepID=A0AAP2G8S0_9RHOB|nr:oligosaccharide repeat unit polymerase [Harenicola maris]
MDQTMILALAFASVALPWGLGQAYGRLPWVSPLHLVAWFAGFGFLLKALAYGFDPGLAFYTRHTSAEGAPLRGAAYLAGFIAMICLGYTLSLPRLRLRHPAGVISASAPGLRWRWPLAALAVLTALMTIALIAKARGGLGLNLASLTEVNTSKQINVNERGVGSTLAGIKTFFFLPRLAFVLILAHALTTRDAASTALAATLGLLLLAVALVSGDRFELVELFAYTFITVLITGTRVSLRLWLLAGAAMLLVGWLAAVMTGLRLGEDGSSPLADLWRQVAGSTYFLDWNASVMLTDRMTPDQHLYGSSYLWWAYGWIPRGFWPDKPAIDLGVYFKRDILGLATGGAYNVTGPGEAFINFGWAGLLIGLPLGAAYRLIEDATLRLRACLRFAGWAFYPLFVYPFVQATLQSSFSSFLVGAMAQLVLAVPLIWLFCPRYASPQNTSPINQGLTRNRFAKGAGLLPPESPRHV